ncbi:MAG: hypothetical protein KGM24_10025 [Elusimicrobia bacterium]|nr:hypothetical protein [Elusimicrobiota bacterium]
MVALMFWIGLPMFAAFLLIRWLQKVSPIRPAADVAALFGSSPLPKKWFRAARRDAKGLASLGDFEKREQAVEAAYAGREAALRARLKAEFLVFDDAAALLEQVDS